MLSLDEILAKGKQNISLDETISSLTELIISGEDGWFIRGHLGNSYLKRVKLRERESSRDKKLISYDLLKAIENFEESKRRGNKAHQNFGLLGESYKKMTNFSSEDVEITHYLKKAIEKP